MNSHYFSMLLYFAKNPFKFISLVVSSIDDSINGSVYKKSEKEASEEQKRHIEHIRDTY